MPIVPRITGTERPRGGACEGRTDIVFDGDDHRIVLKDYAWRCRVNGTARIRRLIRRRFPCGKHGDVCAHRFRRVTVGDVDAGPVGIPRLDPCPHGMGRDDPAFLLDDDLATRRCEHDKQADNEQGDNFHGKD